MRTSNYVIIIVVIFISLYVWSKNKEIKKEKCNNIYNIYLTGPSVKVLKNFSFLSANSIFGKRDFYFTGIYPKGMRAKYKKSRKWIKKYGKGRFKLQEISCDVKVGNVFSENSCTKEFKKIAYKASAVIFTGGPDIPPWLYGEKQQLTTRIKDISRHYFDISFLYHLLHAQDKKRPAILSQIPELPILGICLGMQQMHVASGGKLIQDIPTEVYKVTTVEDLLLQDAGAIHKNYAKTKFRYPYKKWFENPIIIHDQNSFFQNASFKSPMVVHSHHQAIENVLTDFKITARSIDGKIIEGIKHKNYPFVIGVQFHPEYRELYLPQKGKKNKHRINLESVKFHQEFWRQFEHTIRKIPSE